VELTNQDSATIDTRPQPTGNPSTQDYRDKPFNEFITEFKATIKTLFEERSQDESAFIQRDFSPEFLSKIMAHKPLSVAIPSAYGGRGALPKECMSLLQAASYESIPLTLIFGINIALFIEPFAKYADDALKPAVFARFLKQNHMGGLMITEPDYGSDALNMKTAYTQNEQGQYNIKGTKHWQGLTGMAEYWLVAARKQSSSGALSRDVDLFMTDDTQAAQKIKVTERYNNYGLYPIPYGKNALDIVVPESHRLIPETTGIKLLMDTLHRSRLQFPGMATGFIKRALDEATQRCNERLIRGKSLGQFDQVQSDLVKLERAYTLCSAMCYWSAENTSIGQDLALAGIMANTFKAIVSDLMQESAQTLTQLSGSKGYHIKSLGARAIMDSRPFQIFEGPNDMLFTQLAEMMLKQMFKSKEMNLLAFLKTYEYSAAAADHFAKDINVTLEKAMPQRKLVLLGRAMAKIIMADRVLDLGNAGFNPKMVDNCIISLRQEVSNLLNSYQNQTNNAPTEHYNEDSAWLGLL